MRRQNDICDVPTLACTSASDRPASRTEPASITIPNIATAVAAPHELKGETYAAVSARFSRPAPGERQTTKGDVPLGADLGVKRTTEPSAQANTREESFTMTRVPLISRNSDLERWLCCILLHTRESQDGNPGLNLVVHGAAVGAASEQALWFQPEDGWWEEF